MEEKKSDLHDEISKDTSGPAEGSTDPKAPDDRPGLYDESQKDAGEGPAEGSTEPGGPVETNEPE